MLIHNAVITGSLTLNGIDIGDITGSEASVAALNSFSASILSYTSSNNTNISALQSATASLQTFSSSILTYTASNNTNINALQTFSSSILTYTASNDTTNNTQNSRLSSLEVTSGSLINASASFSTRVANTETTSSNLTIASASFSTRVANNEATGSSLVAASASFSTRVANNEATASSLTTASASFSTRISAAESSITSINSVTGSYATTGSNTFVGANYFSNASNAISFTSTGSLYSDGGMRITKDMYVSGTAYFNNVTVYGTQSISYISSSQLNIGTNIISVNTDTPTIRFGGLSVYDSGSTGLTGSILWDSEANHWVYNNPSGSTYSGGMLISGPRASSLGTEQGTTACALMMGQGGDHITSSAIFHYGNATCFYGNKYIDSSGNSCQAGSVCAPTFIGSTIVCSGASIFASTNIRIGSGTSAGNSSDPAITTGGCTKTGVYFNGSCVALGSGGNSLLLAQNGNVGIGTSTPLDQLDINNGTSNSYATLRLAGSNRGGQINFYNQSYPTAQINVDQSGNIDLLTGVFAGASVSSKFSLSNTGQVCFACQVCAPAFVGGTVSGTTGTFSGKLSVSQASTDFVAEFTNTANSTPYGLRVKDAGTPANNYPLLSVTNNAGSTEYFRVNSGTGITTFSSTVCSPSLDIMPSGIGSSTLGGIMRVVTAGTATGIAVGQSNANRYTHIAANDIQVFNDDFFLSTRCAFPLSIGTCYTARLTFAATGVACFSCQVCAPQVCSTYVGASCFLEGPLKTGVRGCYITSAAAIPYIYYSERFPNDASGAFPFNQYGELIFQAGTRSGYNAGFSFVTGTAEVGCTVTPTVKARIFESGVACFACQVCAKSLWFSSNSTGQITFGSNDACNPYVVSDSNNALYLGNNNSYKIFVPNDGADMIFRTAQTYANPEERVRITKYGQLLINATSSQYGPNLYGYNLGVRGTNNQTFISIARANQTLDCQGIIFGLDTTNALLHVFDNIPLGISTNNTERMRIAATGQVCFTCPVTIGTGCAAFGRALTAYTDIVAYFSSQESITMGLSAGTGAQSWGIQVCDTGDGTNTLHLNARGGYVGINKGAGNTADYPLDITGTAKTDVLLVGSACSPSAGINYLGRTGYTENWLVTQGRYRFCFGTPDFYGAIYIRAYGTNYNQGTSQERLIQAAVTLRYADSRTINNIYSIGGACVGGYLTSGISLVWCNINSNIADLIITNSSSTGPDAVFAAELSFLSSGYSLAGKFYRMCYTSSVYDNTNPYV